MQAAVASDDADKVAAKAERLLRQEYERYSRRGYSPAKADAMAHAHVRRVFDSDYEDDDDRSLANFNSDSECDDD